ncbi:HIRA-interacting protein 3 [Trichinella pseudospiralis]|uniref:HIRA-interacting protein 3 n=1 Tax=Trichinella pseudospiralis TaxID=6337 RepID=A0A0V1FUB2_TRIPS|nr:HIRA-interacting protein 3 [Trichinella pseudospiralis]
MVRSKKVKSESSRTICSSTNDEINEDSDCEIYDVKISKSSKSTGEINKKPKSQKTGGSKSKRGQLRTKLSIGDSDDHLSSDGGSSDLSPKLKKLKQNNSKKKDVESKKKKKSRLYLSDDSEENTSSNLHSNDESDEMHDDKKLLATKNQVNKIDVGLNDETAESSSHSSSLLDCDDGDDESGNKQISETEEVKRNDEKNTSDDTSSSDQNDTESGMEKFKKQADLKNQRDEESDSGSSLPSLNSDSSGDRNKRNKKSDEKKSKKMKPSSESVDELSVLRRCIRVAGLFPNYKSLFVDCNSDGEKVNAIKAYFRENGFKGKRITLDACKRFKKRKEEEKEIAGLDIKNITESRLRQRKDPYMLFQPSSSDQSSFQQTPKWKECIKHSDLFTEKTVNIGTEKNVYANFVVGKSGKENDGNRKA